MLAPFLSIILLRSGVFHLNLCLATNQAERSAAGYEMALTAGGIACEGCDALSESGRGTQIGLACGSAAENTVCSA